MRGAARGDPGDFFDRFLVGMDRSGQTRRLNVTLTAHITDPMARH
jgi:hypothetical protein